MDNENARAVEAAFIAASGLTVRQCIDWVDSLSREDRSALPGEVQTRSIMRHYKRGVCSEDEIRRSGYWPQGYWHV